MILSAPASSWLDLEFQHWWWGKGYRPCALKLQLKSGRMPEWEPSQPRLDVDNLKDERVAEEFANRLSRDLGGRGALGNPEELWSVFQTTILDVVGGCLGTYRQGKKKFVSQGTLDTID